jgi:hypothetical protein
MRITAALTAGALALGLLGPAAALAGAASASASGQTVVSNYAEGWHHGRVRPLVIIFGNGGSPVLGGAGSLGPALDWHYWRHGSAYATGNLWTENCVPNCAQGVYYSRWASISLARPHAHGGHNFFTRMVVRFRRGGAWRTVHLSFRRYCWSGGCGTSPLWQRDSGYRWPF